VCTSCPAARKRNPRISWARTGRSPTVRDRIIGGITIVDVPSREDALKWAAKIAAACRCTQEVRATAFDPELEAMLGKVAVDVGALKTRDRR
jgi:hypothetical protein